MKRLAKVLTWTLIASILCCVGVGATLLLHRKTLLSVSSATPTTTNTTAFDTSDGQTRYAPANLVRRRKVLKASFRVFRDLAVYVAVVLMLVKANERRVAGIKSIELQRAIDGERDFTVGDSSISWIIPRAAKLAAIRKPGAWLPWLVLLLIVWIMLDFAFHMQRDLHLRYPPELVATAGASLGVSFGYLLITLSILDWTTIVTLNDQGIVLQLAGKKGRRSIWPCGSVVSCWIEQSRNVQSLPCFTFKAPRKLRAEKTSHLEMPADADVQAVIRFLASKGVVCVDRR